MHGPLARVELGENQVQGLDYAYTLQGWLKGLNSAALTPETDMGRDGLTRGPGQALPDGLPLRPEREYTAALPERRGGP